MRPVVIGESFCPVSVAEWRSWLEKNGRNKKEIWCLFPHKKTDRPGISYFEALEEALCFGWIDGMVKRYDENTVAHRFSPRSSKTSWSEVNKQHARLLIGAGKMTSAGFDVLPDLGTNLWEYPSDILEELRKDAIVWSNFCAFPAYYRDIRIAAVENVRPYPERFSKALQYFIEKTRKNLRYGRFR